MDKVKEEWLNTLIANEELTNELLDEVKKPMSEKTAQTMANIISLLTLKHQILAEIYRLSKDAYTS